MRRTISLIFGFGLCSLVIGLTLGFFGFLHPAFDTVSHFRPYLSILLGLAALILTIIPSRYGRYARWCYLIAFFTFATTVSGYPLSAQTNTVNQSAPVYTLVHFNIGIGNKRQKETLDWIIAQEPDFISITEAARWWEKSLKSLDKQWPYKLDCDETGPRGGLRLYSKLPFSKMQNACSKVAVFGDVKIKLENGTPLRLASVHLRWPWPWRGPKQMNALLPTLETYGANTLLVGDFNATTWSHVMNQFASHGNLKIVKGIGPSWTFYEVPESVAKIIGVPIDNALYGEGVSVIEAKRGPRIGSDHFPFVLKFQVK